MAARAKRKRPKVAHYTATIDGDPAVTQRQFDPVESAYSLYASLTQRAHDLKNNIEGVPPSLAELMEQAADDAFDTYKMVVEAEGREAKAVEQARLKMARGRDAFKAVQDDIAREFGDAVLGSLLGEAVRGNFVQSMARLVRRDGTPATQEEVREATERLAKMEGGEWSHLLEEMFPQSKGS